MNDGVIVSVYASSGLARKAAVLAALLGISRSELIRRSLAREVERLERASGQTARAVMIAEEVAGEARRETA